MLLLSAPHLAGNETKYVLECLSSGDISSMGRFMQKFEEMLAQFVGVKHAVATSSGTTALHVALIVAGVSPGDYVILPNVTFVASLNSILYTGAEPILVDVDSSTWQMDLDLLDRFLSAHTKSENGRCVHVSDGRIVRAIMPVHVLGNMCEMNRLVKLSEKYGLAVIEDASEALGSYFGGQHSGSFGRLGCFSFNGNKIVTTGGGGMIVTNDERLAKRARHLTTQAKAGSDEYFHDEVGYNYRLVNILAAIGVAQMEQLGTFLETKREADSYYKKGLQALAGVQFQQAHPDVLPNNWLFTFRSKQKKKLLTALNSANLQSRSLWVPMNRLPMSGSHRYVSDQDVSGMLYSECVSIPCSSSITREQMDKVIDVIRANL